MLRNVGYVVLAFAAVLAGGSLLVSAASSRTEAADKALDYIRTLQKADGGFPMSGSDSDPGATIDAVFAFVADDTGRQRIGDMDAAGCRLAGAPPSPISPRPGAPGGQRDLPCPVRRRHGPDVPARLR